MPLVDGLFTVAGLPAHPLLVDAVAVLLPLATVCSIGLAVHRRVRRRFGWPVFVLTAVAVAAVPLAEATGVQLRNHLAAPNSLLARHEALGGQLLPWALGFGVAVLLLVVAGKLADRERAASIRSEHGNEHGNGHSNGHGTEQAVGPDRVGGVSTTWRRISVLASVLVIGMSVVTTVDVIRIGTTGAQAVWQGVAH
ncbi:MAG TPA: hypothetical protein VH352_27240 [Pseudonocardiaceae bacterium]|jgi:hypothetical protein|nr:hypothetical protein [Pseudonocardiaceae bacterium]